MSDIYTFLGCTYLQLQPFNSVEFTHSERYEIIFTVCYIIMTYFNNCVNHPTSILKRKEAMSTFSMIRRTYLRLAKLINEKIIRECRTFTVSSFILETKLSPTLPTVDTRYAPFIKLSDLNEIPLYRWKNLIIYLLKEGLRLLLLPHLYKEDIKTDLRHLTEIYLEQLSKMETLMAISKASFLNLEVLTRNCCMYCTLYKQ